MKQNQQQEEHIEETGKAADWFQNSLYVHTYYQKLMTLSILDINPLLSSRSLSRALLSYPKSRYMVLFEASHLIPRYHFEYSRMFTRYLNLRRAVTRYFHWLPHNLRHITETGTSVMVMWGFSSKRRRQQGLHNPREVASTKRFGLTDVLIDLQNISQWPIIMAMPWSSVRPFIHFAFFPSLLINAGISRYFYIWRMSFQRRR